MKKYILLITIFVVLLSSCSNKESLEQNQHYENLSSYKELEDKYEQLNSDFNELTNSFINLESIIETQKHLTEELNNDITEKNTQIALLESNAQLLEGEIENRDNEISIIKSKLDDENKLLQNSLEVLINTEKPHHKFKLVSIKDDLSYKVLCLFEDSTFILYELDVLFNKVIRREYTSSAYLTEYEYGYLFLDYDDNGKFIIYNGEEILRVPNSGGFKCYEEDTILHVYHFMSRDTDTIIFSHITIDMEKDKIVSLKETVMNDRIDYSGLADDNIYTLISYDLDNERVYRYSNEKEEFIIEVNSYNIMSDLGINEITYDAIISKLEANLEQYHYLVSPNKKIIWIADKSDVITLSRDYTYTYTIIDLSNKTFHTKVLSFTTMPYVIEWDFENRVVEISVYYYSGRTLKYRIGIDTLAILE